MINGLTFSQRRQKVLEATTLELRENTLTKEQMQKVKDAVNSLETITYYKHHYVRKTMLKKIIYSLISEALKETE